MRLITAFTALPASVVLATMLCWVSVRYARVD